VIDVSGSTGSPFRGVVDVGAPALSAADFLVA
jgi:hypothetical protein